MNLVADWRAIFVALPVSALCQGLHPPHCTDSGAALCQPKRLVHFVAAATATAGDDADSSGVVWIFDRQSLEPLGRVALAGGAGAMAQLPGSSTLYVDVGGKQPGIAAVDVASASVRGSVAGFQLIPDPSGTQILGYGYDAPEHVTLLAIAPAGVVLGSGGCPATAVQFAYDRFNGTLYGAAIDRTELCVIAPESEAPAPVSLPLGPHPVYDSIEVLDNGAQGLLLLTYSDMADPTSQYHSIAVDLRNGAARTYALPELDGVYLAEANGILYAVTAGGLQPYALSFDADGMPHIRPVVGAVSPALLAPHDDLYYYPAVGGSCSNPEGQPLPCAVGFQVWDIATLQPRAQDASWTLGTPAPQAVMSVLPGYYATPIAK